MIYYARVEGSQRLVKAREGSQRLGIIGLLKIFTHRQTQKHKQYKIKTKNNPASPRLCGRGDWFNAPTHNYIYALVKILTDRHTQYKPKTENNPATCCVVTGLGSIIFLNT